MGSKDKQTPAEVLAAECIAVRCRLVNRVVTKIYDDALRPHGIKVSQMNILAVVALLGGASPSEVCRTLHLEKSTLSRNLGPMKAKGWMEAFAEGKGRGLRLRVTDEGQRLLEELLPLWQEAQRRVLSLIGDDGVGAIGRMAQALWSNEC